MYIGLWPALHMGQYDTCRTLTTMLPCAQESNRVLIIDKLRKLVEAREQLVSIISHELRKPVLGIMGECMPVAGQCG